MQREAENRAGETQGGLTREDLGKLNRAEWDRDREAADGRLRADVMRREQERLDAQQQPGESIMDEVDPDNTAAMRSEGLMPDEGPVLSGGMLDALKKPENMIRLAAMGLGLIGLLLLFWGLRVEAQQVGGQATLPPQTAQPTAAQTAVQTAASTQAITPISAGPIVATQTGTVTAYSVENVQGTGLRYEWRNSATCGTQTGQATATFSWDHPHPPCPDEPFHGSFISVQITDPSNRAVVRQYAGGSRPGRGEVPAGGGAFTVQTTPTPARTTAAATTAAATGATVAAATSAPTAGGAVNYPLIALGLVFLTGALGLFFGGPRLAGGPVIADPKDAEDPCAKEKARLAAAQAAAAAAEARLRELDALAESAQSTQRDAAAKDQAVTAATAGASSYVNNQKQTVYTNPEQRARIEGAQADAAAAHAAADAAQAAHNAAGGAGARQAAADGVFTTNRELRDAQAALDACLRIVSMSTPTPAPTPTGGGPTTGGGGTATGGTGAGIGTGTGPSDGTRARSRECPDGPTRNETTSEHRFSMHDLGNAQIEAEGTRLNADDSHARGFLDHLGRVDNAFKAGKIGSGLAQGEVAGPALDAVDFPDFLTYFGEIREKMDESMRRLLEQLRQHRRQGTYTIRFTTHHFLLTCRKWEECVNDRYVAKSEVKLTLLRSSESTRGPEVLSDETARNRWLDGTLGAAHGSNDRAQQAADTFRQECGQ